jgi:hypothetical protein
VESATKAKHAAIEMMASMFRKIKRYVGYPKESQIAIAGDCLPHLQTSLRYAGAIWVDSGHISLRYSHTMLVAKRKIKCIRVSVDL